MLIYNCGCGWLLSTRMGPLYKHLWWRASQHPTVSLSVSLCLSIKINKNRRIRRELRRTLVISGSRAVFPCQCWVLNGWNWGLSGVFIRKEQPGPARGLSGERLWSLMAWVPSLGPTQWKETAYSYNCHQGPTHARWPTWARKRHTRWIQLSSDSGSYPIPVNSRREREFNASATQVKLTRPDFQAALQWMGNMNPSHFE